MRAHQEVVVNGRVPGNIIL